jgi:MFS family permease
MTSSEPEVQGDAKGRWLTRNVFAIGLLSLFSDAGHELTTAILPLFLASFAGSAAALGVIEGFSDAASSVLKLWMSFYSDRVGKRKPILAVGYFVTAMMGTLGLVTAIWQIVLIRMVAWMGRGARGPVRDALLSESVPPQAHGRAFGFETMMDTSGAIIGPAIALSLVGVIALRHIFLIAFVPGAITVLIVLFLLKDIPRKPQPGIRILATLRELPRSFWRYVAAVGIFGFGNFAHSLLILRAITVLTPSHGSVQAGKIVIGLYIFHNVVYAAASYPVGMLGDRMNKKPLLAVGYALFALMCAESRSWTCESMG